uniref:Uncharacterized protein n=1 Tax=Anguilla anguilla TaxID=7936 RepID=A0A0E9QW42_ANGAN
MVYYAFLCSTAGHSDMDIVRNLYQGLGHIHMLQLCTLSG